MMSPVVLLHYQFFFYRRYDVEAYSMGTNSLLKVFVQNSTDEKELQNDLEKLNAKFFTKCRLQIAKGKFMKKNTGSFVKNTTMRGIWLHQSYITR